MKALTEQDRDAVVEQLYEAYRLGRISGVSEHLPMWHEPESRARVPGVEAARLLEVVERIRAEAARDLREGLVSLQADLRKAKPEHFSIGLMQVRIKALLDGVS